MNDWYTETWNRTNKHNDRQMFRIGGEKWDKRRNTPLHYTASDFRCILSPYLLWLPSRLSFHLQSYMHLFLLYNTSMYHIREFHWIFSVIFSLKYYRYIHSNHWVLRFVCMYVIHRLVHLYTICAIKIK